MWENTPRYFNKKKKGGKLWLLFLDFLVCVVENDVLLTLRSVLRTLFYDLKIITSPYLLNMAQ